MNSDQTSTPDEGTRSEEQDPGAGSGDGGSLGTPSGLMDEEPPSAEQEANEAVSGGGMVDPSSEGDPKDTVEKDEDRSSSAG